MQFRSFKTLLLWLLICSLASCTFNPFSHDNELTGSPVGVIGGGAAGATTAAVLGASKPVIGLAGIGGAGLGYYVTTLRFAAGGIIHGGGQVFTLGDYVTIILPSDRLFEPNTADLLPEAEPMLDSTVTVLQRYPDQNIMISGNTSGFGTQKFEQKLSQRRAERVASYLWAHGITSYKKDSNDMRRLIYVGYGDHFPIANNLHIDSLRKNSRIQITSFPSKQQLELDKCHKVFNNVGDSDTSLSANQIEPSIDSAFRDNERLPEQPETSNDFKDSLNDMPSSQAPIGGSTRPYYVESGNLKGNDWQSYNTIAGDRVMQHKSYSSQRNYKGE